VYIIQDKGRPQGMENASFKLGAIQRSGKIRIAGKSQRCILFGKYRGKIREFVKNS